MLGFKILYSSGSLSGFLACIRISRELIKTDCCTLPLKLLIRKEWIYISHKFSRDADAAGQGLLLVNHCSTPQAMSRKPTG